MPFPRAQLPLPHAGESARMPGRSRQTQKVPGSLMHAPKKPTRASLTHRSVPTPSQQCPHQNWCGRHLVATAARARVRANDRMQNSQARVSETQQVHPTSGIWRFHPKSGDFRKSYMVPKPRKVFKIDVRSDFWIKASRTCSIMRSTSHWCQVTSR